MKTKYKYGDASGLISLLVLASLLTMMSVYADLNSTIINLQSPANGADITGYEPFRYTLTNADSNIKCTLHGNWTGNFSHPLSGSIVNSSSPASDRTFYISDSLQLLNASSYTWAIRCENLTNASDCKWSDNYTFIYYVSKSIQSCQTIHYPGYYTLGHSLESNSTCISVETDDVTIDCTNHTINYSRSSKGYGIFASGDYGTPLDNITIRNCTIIQISNETGSHAVKLNYVNYVNVTANTISVKANYSDGIYSDQAYNSTITGNSITTYDICSSGIQMRSSDNNTLSNNTIMTDNVQSFGMDVYYSSINTIINNIIATSAANSFGILLRESTGNTLFGNTITAQNADTIFDTEGDTQAPQITIVSLGSETSRVAENQTWLNLSINELGYCIQTDYYKYPTNDSTPPQPRNESPVGFFNYSGSYTIKFYTDERAACKGSFDEDLDYGEMNVTFHRTEHSITNYSFTNTTDFNGSHTIFVKCRDVAGNIMDTGYNWSFTANRTAGPSGSSGSGGGASGLWSYQYSRLYANLTNEYTYLINTTCYDIAGNSNTTSVTWIVDYIPPRIDVIYPIEDILLMSKVNETYAINISFTTNELTTCYRSLGALSISRPPRCTIVYCDDNGCVYSCSIGGGGGGSGYVQINQIPSADYSYPFSFHENYKYKNNLKCYDANNNSALEFIDFFVGRENALTLEWAAIMRPLLVENQTVNFKASITNVNTVDRLNLTVKYPNGSTYSKNYALDIAPSIDEEFNISFANTTQTGNYIFNVTFFDNLSNSVNASLNFSVFNPAYHNVSLTKGSLGFLLEYTDPDSGSIINVGAGNASNGTSSKLPNTTVQLKIKFDDNKANIIIPGLKNLSLNTKIRAINLSHDTVNTQYKIGTNNRYKPLNTYAFEVENYSDYNSSFILGFYYPSYNISDPLKLVMFKANYDFDGMVIDYSNGIFYRYNDLNNPLYINETEEYVHINLSSFSYFLFGEDQAQAEICGDGIDNDYDGYVDEDCSTDGDSSSPRRGSSGDSLLIIRECENSSMCSSIQVCKDYRCIELKCGYCEYIKDHECKKYMCCSDSECRSGSICKNHICIKEEEEKNDTGSDEIKKQARQDIDNAWEAIFKNNIIKDTREAEEVLKQAEAAYDMGEYKKASDLANKAEYLAEVAPVGETDKGFNWMLVYVTFILLIIIVAGYLKRSTICGLIAKFYTPDLKKIRELEGYIAQIRPIIVKAIAEGRLDKNYKVKLLEIEVQKDRAKRMLENNDARTHEIIESVVSSLISLKNEIEKTTS